MIDLKVPRRFKKYAKHIEETKVCPECCAQVFATNGFIVEMYPGHPTGFCSDCDNLYKKCISHGMPSHEVTE